MDQWIEVWHHLTGSGPTYIRGSPFQMMVLALGTLGIKQPLFYINITHMQL